MIPILYFAIRITLPEASTYTPFNQSAISAFKKAIKVCNRVSFSVAVVDITKHDRTNPCLTAPCTRQHSGKESGYK
jgi:hypothetical protein